MVVENSTPIGEQPAPSSSDEGMAVLGLTTPAPEPTSPAAAPAPAAVPVPVDVAAQWTELQQSDPNAAKFKTPAEMLTSLKQLQGFFTQFRQLGLEPDQALAMLQQRTEAGSEELEPAPGETTDEFLERLAADPQATINDLVEKRMARVLEPMQFESAKLTAKGMWDEARTRHPDIDQHEQEMVALLQSYPQPLQAAISVLPNAMDFLYNMVTVGTPDKIQARIDEAVTKAKADLLEQIRTGTFEGGGGGIPPGAAQGGISQEQRIAADIVNAGRRPVIMRAG